MKRLWFLIIAAAISGTAFAQNAQLMAWYPLNHTPNDSTGQYPPMTLDNTPYLPGGGILCNGIYRNSGLPNWCDAQTPVFPITLFQSFSLSFQFKIDTVMPGYANVMTGGRGWRWIGLNLMLDGTVVLRYNGRDKAGTLRCRTGTWHTAMLTYDSAAALGRLYLDDALACEQSFTIEHGADEFDRNFGITNFGNGSTFRGSLRDVRIYSKARIHTGTTPPAPAIAVCSISHAPQPVQHGVVFTCTLPAAVRAHVAAFDVLGRPVATLLDAFLDAGTHALRYETTALPPGMYVVILRAGDQIATTRLLRK